ncbi:MAG: hypothetical protein ACTSRS_10525, partial [Candidatus Helarchaeota archaeon]
GNLVRVKGGELCVVLQNYDPDTITHVLLARNRAEIQADRTQFRQRQKRQSAGWQTKKGRIPQIHRLLENANKLSVRS